MNNEERQLVIPQGTNLMSSARFQHMLAVSEFLSKSDLIPAHFRGKTANVFVALEFSLRQDMSPFMVMQNLFVIHGRPGFEAKLVIALVNQSKQYDHELEYEIQTDKDSKIIFCRAYTAKQGRRIDGPPITEAMVKAEKWDQPKQQGYPSKWVTMPEMMYRYRAATYFARVNCPEVLMGLQTREEIEDIINISPSGEVIFPEEALPSSQDTSAFDALFAAKNPTPEQKEFLDKFLAMYPKQTPEEIKSMAAMNFDGEKGAFWPVFLEHFEKQKKKVGRPKKDASGPATASEITENGPPLTQDQGEDNDGQNEPVMASEEQLGQIVLLARKARVSIESICGDYEVEKLAGLTQAQASGLILDLEAAVEAK